MTEQRTLFEVWNVSAEPPHHARDTGFATRKEADEWMAQYCSHVRDKYEIRETAAEGASMDRTS